MGKGIFFCYAYFFNIFVPPPFVPEKSSEGQILVPHCKLSIYSCIIGRNHMKWTFHKSQLDFVFVRYNYAIILIYNNIQINYAIS